MALVPPADRRLRKRFYGILGKARTARPHQRQKLLALARSLMEPADGRPVAALPEPATVVAASPLAPDGRPRPSSRTKKGLSDE
jgi:hypothetical protein